jgi:hypothetical protein
MSRKTTGYAIIMTLVISLTAIVPMTSALQKWNEGFTDPILTTGTIQTAPPGPPAPGGADAPVVLYQWITPDEDPNKDCHQVNIVPSDDKTIYVWTVATDPEGRDDIEFVFVQLFYPNIIPWCNTELDNWLSRWLDIALPADIALIEDAVLAAELSGKITKVEGDEILHQVFDQPGWYVWVAEIPMSYCYPAGVYTAWCWAQDTDKEVSIAISTPFEWVAAAVLETDFEAPNNIDFGNFEPGVEKYVHGDELMLGRDPGAPLNMPTVKNEGNTKIEIQVKNTEMTHTVEDQYKITEFDVKFMGVEQDYSANVWETLQVHLCLCQTKKIDFSIHPGANLPPGTYEGSLMLHIAAVEFLTC